MAPSILADAYALMDYWYTLDAAVPLTEYIGYYSPVKGVRSGSRRMSRGRARRRPPEVRATSSIQIAHDSFPSADQLANIYPVQAADRGRGAPVE